MYKKQQQELEILKNVVAQIQSNEKDVRKEMGQLSGRVDHLEKNSDHHVVRRQASKTSNLTLCPKKCAFDFPACTNPQNSNVLPGNIANIPIMKNPPTNCKDLKVAGYILSGYYSVKREGKINLVFCNFTASPFDGIMGS